MNLPNQILTQKTIAKIHEFDYGFNLSYILPYSKEATINMEPSTHYAI